MTLEFLEWIGLALISFFLLRFGVRRNFFVSPSIFKDSFFPIRWYHPLIAFICYLGSIALMFAMAPLLFSNPLFEHDIWGYSVLNFSAFALIFIALALYLKILPQSISRPILSRDHNFWDPSHFRFAAFALLIAFPLVIFFNESLSILICYCFKITELPDQAAVRFLKATLEYPILTILTMFTIVILGPIIEEILFRGFLQSWIRQHLGPQKAICITSVLFSFFHYSYDQGLANIPIIGSLCIFAYFLGFVYEKKGSLIAPITLHALFNGCNVLSLYLLGSS